MQRLLLSGIIAGPLYITTGLIQAYLREGFDLGRHPLSVLANGPGGWVQTVNFVVTGLLVIGVAYAIGTIFRPQSRAIGWILGFFGASMLVAAAFPADPIDGFPPGTPSGVPQTISTTGLVHFAAGATGFLALGIAGLVAGRALSKRGNIALSRTSHVVGFVVLLGFLAGPALPLSLVTVGIWSSVLAGFAWLSILSMHLRARAE